MSTTEQSRREAWLAERQTGIGASEAASILGVGYETPMEVWARKRGLVTEKEWTKKEERRLRIGLKMQPIIIEELVNETEFEVVQTDPYEIVRHSKYPFLLATLDGLIFDHPDQTKAGVLEIKKVGGYNAKDWEDDIPLKFQIQVQMQLLVTDRLFAYIAALIGDDELVYRRIERDEAFIDTLRVELIDFWSLVQTGEKPAVDASDRTRKILQKLHPNDNGEEIMLPVEAMDWAKEWDDSKAAIKEAKAKKILAENCLVSAIGDNTFGVLPDGSRLSLKTTPRKAYDVHFEESSYRTLRIKKG